MGQIKCQKLIPAKKQKVFAHLSDPRNVAELLKPSIDVELENAPPELMRDVIYSFSMTRFGFNQQVKILILEVKKDELLIYKQFQGVFEKWVHTTRFENSSEDQTMVTEIVDYKVPFGLLGFLLDDLLIKNDMKNILQNRLDKAADFFAHEKTDSI